MIKIKHVNFQTYEADGRKSIGDIYESYERFEDESWIRERVHNQKFRTKRNRKMYTPPILSFRTKIKGPAIWIISGIHGEEPAGPNAIAGRIGFLNDLARKIPLVVLPLCNPVGYILSWRYPNLRRYKKGYVDRSVGSSEHLLLNDGGKRPRLKKPLCEEADDITAFLLRQIRKYSPVLVLDFHEDEVRTGQYIYSQGKLGRSDPVAKEVISILKEKGFKIKTKDRTRFDQKIIDGIIGKVKDSSIDELLASNKYIIGRKIRRKPAAKSVIVLETSTKDAPIETRMKAHEEVLLSAEKLYDMARGIKKKKQNVFKRF